MPSLFVFLVAKQQRIPCNIVVQKGALFHPVVYTPIREKKPSKNLTFSFLNMAENKETFLDRFQGGNP